jgi:hypothetical protein
MTKNKTQQKEKTRPDVRQENSRESAPILRAAMSAWEFSKAFGLGLTTVNALLRDGSIHSIRVRGRRLIPITECEDFIFRMSMKQDNRNK